MGIVFFLSRWIRKESDAVWGSSSLIYDFFFSGHCVSTAPTGCINREGHRQLQQGCHSLSQFELFITCSLSGSSCSHHSFQLACRSTSSSDSVYASLRFRLLLLIFFLKWEKRKIFLISIPFLSRFCHMSWWFNTNSLFSSLRFRLLLWKLFRNDKTERPFWIRCWFRLYHTFATYSLDDSTT